MNGDFTSFDAHTVKMMIRMFDVDKSGTINFEEFWYDSFNLSTSFECRSNKSVVDYGGFLLLGVLSSTDLTRTRAAIYPSTNTQKLWLRLVIDSHPHSSTFCTQPTTKVEKEK